MHDRMTPSTFMMILVTSCTCSCADASICLPGTAGHEWRWARGLGWAAKLWGILTSQSSANRACIMTKLDKGQYVPKLSHCQCEAKTTEVEMGR